MARRTPVKVPVTQVRQDDLRKVLDLRLAVSEARKKLADVAKDLESQEAAVYAGLRAGWTVEAGEWMAGIKESDGARRPRWREEFVKRCGEQAAEQVIAETPAPLVVALVITPAPGIVLGQ